MGRRKASEFIERFALRHSLLASFGEIFPEVRHRKSSNSPLGISAVRLRDAEMHRACVRLLTLQFSTNAAPAARVVDHEAHQLPEKFPLTQFNCDLHWIESGVLIPPSVSLAVL
jgi:hypothetical protein